MQNLTRRSGFTLVELLVVIAIIAILAAILLPAMNAAFLRAEKAQAQTEVKSIETAVKAYLSEYSRFPNMAVGGDYSYGYPSGTQDNDWLMNTLRSVDGNGNPGYTNNPRRIVFIEVSDGSLSSGKFMDPWNNQYKISCDTDFENITTLASGGPTNQVVGRNVVVWTTAPDGTQITSWK